MAQWMGQYSGHTHATKLADLEASLRKAMKAWVTCPPIERSQKGKAARRLAERVLAARSRILRAQIATLRPTDEEKRDSLQHRLEDLETGGVDAVLAEFT